MRKILKRDKEERVGREVKRRKRREERERDLLVRKSARSKVIELRSSFRKI